MCEQHLTSLYYCAAKVVATGMSHAGSHICREGAISLAGDFWLPHFKRGSAQASLALYP